MTVIEAITSVARGHTFAVAAGEGVDSTLNRWGLIGGVLHTGALVRCQFHAIRAATYPLEQWHWEAEVAAVAIWICLPVAGVGAWEWE